MDRKILPIVAALALFGCDQAANSSAADSAPHAAERDSAGIRIVEHEWFRDGVRASAAWTIADEPVLTIGRRHDSPDHELFRVAGAGLFSDGRVAVALNGPPELRIYDSTGDLVNRIGREGSGPGEFRFISSLWIGRGDTLATYDARLRRVSLFSESGQHLRDQPFRAPADVAAGLTPWNVRGVLEGGHMVGVFSAVEEDRTGAQRRPWTVVVLDSTASLITSFGPFGGQEMYIGPPQQSPQGLVSELGTPPFARTTLIASGAGGVVTAENGHYDITRWTADGRPSLIVRTDVPSQPVEDSDLESLLPPVELSAAERGLLLEGLRSTVTNATLPLLDVVLVEPDGHIWIVEFGRPHQSTRWLVRLDADGQLSRALELPREYQFLGARGDSIVVLSRDADEVEAVEVFEVVPVGSR